MIDQQELDASVSTYKNSSVDTELHDLIEFSYIKLQRQSVIWIRNGEWYSWDTKYDID